MLPKCCELIVFEVYGRFIYINGSKYKIPFMSDMQFTPFTKTR